MDSLIRMALPVRNSRIRLSQGLIFWREVGQGAPLVFLHGSWQDSSQWMPVIESLSSDYHCLAPDLLRFGESENPNIHYSIDLEVDCLAEWLRALKLPAVHLVGHSLGGWVAASFALKYPHQVAGVVLLEPEGVQTREKRDRWAETRLLLAPWVDWGLRLLLPFSQFCKIPWIGQVRQRRQQLLKSLPACKLLFYRRRSEVKAEYLDERLHLLKVPVLILQGERDHSIAADLNQVYARRAPEADLERLPDAGEAILETHPDSIAERIRAFVARVPAE